MKKLTNKIISFTLAFMMTVSLAPAGLHVHGEENPASISSVQEISETPNQQESKKEKPQGTDPNAGSSKTETTNANSKDSNITTEESSQPKENTEVKDEKPSEPVAQAKQAAPAEERTANPAPEKPATNVEDLAHAVTLSVDAYEGKKLTDRNTYWSNEKIDGVVSLQLSGAQASIENAKLVIKVQNSPSISELAVTEADKSDRNEKKDENGYHYTISHFAKLETGNNIGLPFSFKFDGSRMPKNGDSVEVSVALYQEKDNNLIEIKKASRTFTAQVDTYGTFTSVDNKQVVDGEYTKILNAEVSNKENEKMDPNSSTSGFWASFYVYSDKTDEDKGNHSYGYSAKTTGEVIVTIPEGMEIMPSYLVDMYKSIEGQPGKYSYVVKNPWLGGDLTYQGKKRSGFYFSIYLRATNAYFNREMPIEADIILTGRDGDQQKMHTSFKVKVLPKQFKQTGTSLLHFFGDRNKIRDLLTAKIGITEKEKEMYGRWLADPFTYYAREGSLYTGPDDFTNDGRYYTAEVYNENNGKNPSEAIGNVNVGKLNSITFEVSDKQNLKNIFIYGYKQRPLTMFPTHDEKKYESELNTKLDEIGNKLYGINGDQKVLIHDNLKRCELYSIPEDQKFSKVVLEFDQPVIVDNGDFYVLASSKLTDEEIKKYDGYKDEEHKESYEMKVSAKLQTADRPEKDSSKTASNVVSTLKKPFIYLESAVRSIQPLPYSQSGKDFDFTINLVKPNSSEKSIWGPIKELTGLKTITILPEGIEIYKAGLDGIRTNRIVEDANIVENYKGTNLKALIIDFKNKSPEKDEFLWMKMHATKDAAKENTIDTYMVYDHNDFIQPYEKVKYTDQLDLDDDNNNKELFVKTSSKVYVTLPTKLVLKNQTTEPIYGYKSDAPTIDSDSNFKFDITLQNSTRTSISELTVIDILPYNGDIHLTKDKDGKYQSRGSTMETPMTSNLIFKDENIRQKFDVYYLKSNTGSINADKVKKLMENQPGSDLEWVSESAITPEDFKDKKIVGYKLVLKNGNTFEFGDELNVDVPVYLKKFKMQALSMKNGQYDIPEEKAINTSIYSSNGGSFTEANETIVKLSQYIVKGKIYDDYNNNGQYDEGIDYPIEGAIVKLINNNAKKGNDESQNTSPAEKNKLSLLSLFYTNAFAEGTINKSDDDDKEIEAITDKNGDYLFYVPKRGSNYRIEVTANGRKIIYNGETPTTGLYVNKVEQDGNFDEVKVNPDKRENIISAAFVPHYTVRLHINWVNVSKEDKEKFKFKLVVVSKPFDKNSEEGTKVSRFLDFKESKDLNKVDQVHNIIDRSSLVDLDTEVSSADKDKIKDKEWMLLPGVVETDGQNDLYFYSIVNDDESYDTKKFTVTYDSKNKNSDFDYTYNYTIKAIKKESETTSSGQIYVHFHFGDALYQDYSIGIAPGQKLSESQLPIPVKPGYEFEGWYYKLSDLDYEELKPFDITKPIYGSIHLYPKWKKLPLVIPQFEDKKSVPNTADN